jgi:MFS family permease
LLVAGQLTSNVGDAFYAVALPWYVLAGHGGALLLGTVLAAYGIPRTALVAVGGHAADRWRPWTVMLVADVVRVAAVTGLAVVALDGPAHAALLVPVAAVLGAGEGLFLPGSFAIVAELLPGEELQAGNSITSGGTQLATLLGPALGGVTVALVGAPAAFAVDAVTFAVSALTLAGIRAAAAPDRRDAPEPAPAAAGPGSATTLRSVLRTERALQVMLAVTVAANLGSGGVGEVALPALARDGFGTGAGGYGGLIAAMGAGALLGTVVAAQARQARRPAIVASAAFAAEAAFLAVIPYLGGALPAGFALAAFGALNGFGNVVSITAFQRWAPPSLLGRLMGVLLLASFGIFPVSVLLGGWVVHALGAAAFFPIAAALLLAPILAGLTQRAWREFGRDDAGRAASDSALIPAASA